MPPHSVEVKRSFFIFVSHFFFLALFIKMRWAITDVMKLKLTIKKLTRHYKCRRNLVVPMTWSVGSNPTEATHANVDPSHSLARKFETLSLQNEPGSSAESSW